MCVPLNTTTAMHHGHLLKMVIHWSSLMTAELCMYLCMYTERFDIEVCVDQILMTHCELNKSSLVGS